MMDNRQFPTLNYVTEHEKEAMLAYGNKNTSLDKHVSHSFTFVRPCILPAFNVYGDLRGT